MVVPKEVDNPGGLAQRAKSLCQEQGFQLARIAPAVPAPPHPRLDRWRDEGKLGDMAYLERHAAIRRDPSLLLAGARSIVLAALAYPLEKRESPPGSPPLRISSYATRPDYHVVLRDKLHRVGRGLQEACPKLLYRVAVDSAPLFERDYAQLAGLGWIGKNTLLLHPQLGSAFFLGAVLVDQLLQPDEPWETGHCGTCQRCLDACPTQAFDGPYELDPSRCISYWTIEHRGPIPDPMVDRLEGWLFGCDDCQTACPWNRKRKFSSAASSSIANDTFDPELATLPELAYPDIHQILALDELELKRRFGHTPLLRARREGLLRNALALLAGGDWTAKQQETLRPFVQRLTRDEEEMVRDAALRVFACWEQGDSTHSPQIAKSIKIDPLSQVE